MDSKFFNQFKKDIDGSQFFKQYNRSTVPTLTALNKNRRQRKLQQPIASIHWYNTFPPVFYDVNQLLL